MQQLRPSSATSAATAGSGSAAGPHAAASPAARHLTRCASDDVSGSRAALPLRERATQPAD
jgi:hypothetical protein